MASTMIGSLYFYLTTYVPGHSELPNIVQVIVHHTPKGEINPKSFHSARSVLSKLPTTRRKVHVLVRNLKSRFFETQNPIVILNKMIYALHQRHSQMYL